MKKFFFSIVVVATLFCSCKTGQTITDQDENTFGVSATSAKTSQPDTLGVAGVDSLLRVDFLPAVSKWPVSYFRDEETGAKLEFRTLFDRTTNTIYTLKTLADGRRVLIKRSVRVR